MPYFLYSPELEDAQNLSRRAKELIFEAQDRAAAHPLPPPATGRVAGSGLREHQTTQRRILRCLRKIRTELEMLDNYFTGAATKDNEQLCNCGGWANARPHTDACPMHARWGDA